MKQRERLTAQGHVRAKLDQIDAEQADLRRQQQALCVARAAGGGRRPAAAERDRGSRWPRASGTRPPAPSVDEHGPLLQARAMTVISVDNFVAAAHALHRSVER